jgi:hypothetical protein
MAVGTRPAKQTLSFNVGFYCSFSLQVARSNKPKKLPEKKSSVYTLGFSPGLPHIPVTKFFNPACGIKSTKHVQELYT